MPFIVTRRLCGPTTSSREVQPRSSGSKEPSRRGGGSGAGATGEVDEAVGALVELGGDRGQAGAGVAQRQPGPAGEVAVARRAVAGEVAPRQLGQRRLAVRGPVDPSLRTAGGSSSSGPLRGPSQSRTRTKACSEPAIGPRTVTPASAAAKSTWTRACRRSAPRRPPAAPSARPGSADPPRPAPARSSSPPAGLGPRRPPAAAGSRWRCGEAAWSGPAAGIVLAADQVQRAAVEPGDEQPPLAQRPVDVGGAQTCAPCPHRQPRPPRVLPLDRQQPLGDLHRLPSGPAPAPAR